MGVGIETCLTYGGWQEILCPFGTAPFQVLAKSVPEGAKFCNTPSACGGDRNFEDFASLLKDFMIIPLNLDWLILILTSLENSTVCDY